MSGWVERSFWTMAVASASGGVHTSFARAAKMLAEVHSAASPRSFTLTPELARQPVAVPATAYRLKPVLNGLRLASGGLAAALVAVVVIAVAGGNGDSQSSRESAAIVHIESSSGANIQAWDNSRDTEPTTPAYSSGDSDVAGGQVMGSGGGGSGAGAVPTTAATQEGSLAPAETTPPSASDMRGVSQPSPAASDTAKDEYSVNLSDTDANGASPEANAVRQSDADQGVGTLTVIAIALAVLLTVALIGSIALSGLGRRA